ncbi:MAG: hypothetical protein MUC43_14455 [Pirellula sp.]|nr:hypothetical protein [Pirellula sp.]
MFAAKRTSVSDRKDRSDRCQTFLDIDVSPSQSSTKIDNKGHDAFASMHVACSDVASEYQRQSRDLATSNTEAVDIRESDSRSGYDWRTATRHRSAASDAPWPQLTICDFSTHNGASSLSIDCQLNLSLRCVDRAQVYAFLMCRVAKLDGFQIV